MLFRFGELLQEWADRQWLRLAKAAPARFKHWVVDELGFSKVIDVVADQ